VKIFLILVKFHDIVALLEVGCITKYTIMWQFVITVYVLLD